MAGEIKPDSNPRVIVNVMQAFRTVTGAVCMGRKFHKKDGVNMLKMLHKTQEHLGLLKLLEVIIGTVVVLWVGFSLGDDVFAAGKYSIEQFLLQQATRPDVNLNSYNGVATFFEGLLNATIYSNPSAQINHTNPGFYLGEGNRILSIYFLPINNALKTDSWFSADSDTLCAIDANNRYSMASTIPQFPGYTLPCTVKATRAADDILSVNYNISKKLMNPSIPGFTMVYSSAQKDVSESVGISQGLARFIRERYPEAVNLELVVFNAISRRLTQVAVQIEQFVPTVPKYQFLSGYLELNIDAITPGTGQYFNRVIWATLLILSIIRMLSDENNEVLKTQRWLRSKSDSCGLFENCSYRRAYFWYYRHPKDTILWTLTDAF